MELSGATSEAKQANQEVQELVDQLKDHINLRTNSSFQKLTVVNYKSQVVAGTNFFVKVNADDKTHLHLRIFRPLPFQGNEPQLHKIETDKKHDDPIDYF